eukprot:1783480-Rhodomonas_salina.1
MLHKSSEHGSPYRLLSETMDSVAGLSKPLFEQAKSALSDMCEMRGKLENLRQHLTRTPLRSIESSVRTVTNDTIRHTATVLRTDSGPLVAVRHFVLEYGNLSNSWGNSELRDVLKILQQVVQETEDVLSACDSVLALQDSLTGIDSSSQQLQDRLAQILDGVMHEEFFGSCDHQNLSEIAGWDTASAIAGTLADTAVLKDPYLSLARRSLAESSNEVVEPWSALASRLSPLLHVAANGSDDAEMVLLNGEALAAVLELEPSITNMSRTARNNVLWVQEMLQTLENEEKTSYNSPSKQALDLLAEVRLLSSRIRQYMDPKISMRPSLLQIEHGFQAMQTALERAEHVVRVVARSVPRRVSSGMQVDVMNPTWSRSMRSIELISKEAALTFSDLTLETVCQQYHRVESVLSWKEAQTLRLACAMRGGQTHEHTRARVPRLLQARDQLRRLLQIKTPAIDLLVDQLRNQMFGGRMSGTPQSVFDFTRHLPPSSLRRLLLSICKLPEHDLSAACEHVANQSFAEMATSMDVLLSMEKMTYCSKTCTAACTTVTCQTLESLDVIALMDASFVDTMEGGRMMTEMSHVCTRYRHDPDNTPAFEAIMDQVCSQDSGLPVNEGRSVGDILHKLKAGKHIPIGADIANARQNVDVIDTLSNAHKFSQTLHALATEISWRPDSRPQGRGLQRAEDSLKGLLQFLEQGSRLPTLTGPTLALAKSAMTNAAALSDQIKGCFSSNLDLAWKGLQIVEDIETLDVRASRATESIGRANSSISTFSAVMRQTVAVGAHLPESQYDPFTVETWSRNNANCINAVCLEAIPRSSPEYRSIVFPAKFPILNDLISLSNGQKSSFVLPGHNTKYSVRASIFLKAGRVGNAIQHPQFLLTMQATDELRLLKYPSLFVVITADGAVQSVIPMVNQDGSPFLGSVSGVAIVNQIIWTCDSGRSLVGFEQADLLNQLSSQQQTEMKIRYAHALPIIPYSVSFDPGRQMLWVAEFETEQCSSIAYGYKAADTGLLNTSSTQLQVGCHVRGMAFFAQQTTDFVAVTRCGDGHDPCRLEFHMLSCLQSECASPSQQPVWVLSTEHKLSTGVLGSSEHRLSVRIPFGAEGVVFDGFENLLIGFSSATNEKIRLSGVLNVDIEDSMHVLAVPFLLPLPPHWTENSYGLSLFGFEAVPVGCLFRSQSGECEEHISESCLRADRRLWDASVNVLSCRADVWVYGVNLFFELAVDLVAALHIRGRFCLLPNLVEAGLVPKVQARIIARGGINLYLVQGGVEIRGIFADTELEPMLGFLVDSHRTPGVRLKLQLNIIPVSVELLLWGQEFLCVKICKAWGIPVPCGIKWCPRKYWTIGKWSMSTQRIPLLRNEPTVRLTSTSSKTLRLFAQQVNDKYVFCTWYAFPDSVDTPLQWYELCATTSLGNTFCQTFEFATTAFVKLEGLERSGGATHFTVHMSAVGVEKASSTANVVWESAASELIGIAAKNHLDFETSYVQYLQSAPPELIRHPCVGPDLAYDCVLIGSDLISLRFAVRDSAILRVQAGIWDSRLADEDNVTLQDVLHVEQLLDIRPRQGSNFVPSITSAVFEVLLPLDLAMRSGNTVQIVVQTHNVRGLSKWQLLPVLVERSAPHFLPGA